MSGPILERLNARIAVEPALDHLDTLFVDLQDARDAIVASVAQNEELKNMLAVPPPSVTPAQPVVFSQPAENITEAVAWLKEARERLAVNSLSTVGDNIDKAIKLLD